MNAHKRNVFGLFFLFWFGTYAVLPLICTLTSAGAKEVVTVKNEVPSVAGRCRGMARWRLVSPNRSSVTFLMKKKRAILPEDSSAKIVSPYALSSSGADTHFSCSDPMRQVDRTCCDKGDRYHHRPYLGHSPPYA